MPRQANVSAENNFVGGLNTEATGLNFPENACTETYNCVFDVSGRVYRRFGFDFEEDFVPTEVIGGRSNKAITTYVWKAVAGVGTKTFVAVQVGFVVWFFEPVEGQPLSNLPVPSAVDLQPYLVSGATLTDMQFAECQFASGDGKLFIVNPLMEPIYITYDPVTETFDAAPIVIKIRDFDGVEDGLATDQATLTLTDEHHYNLRNQGWVPGPNFITQYFADVHEYPSNAQVWWLYKNADGEFDPSASLSNRGNSPAPRGHHILEAFNQDRSAVSSVPNIPIITPGPVRPKAIAFFAGRVFYSGVDAAGFGTKIYFSQIVSQSKHYGIAHQANDPTSETLFDLLPTDGGVIVIPDAGSIIKLFPLDNNLVVFASNGIWVITGSQGIGFTANDYTIKSISNIETLSSSSFINVGGMPAWWANDGIYVLSASPQGLVAQSATDKKIATFYADIPTVSKRYAKGTYNSIDKTVQWLYRANPEQSNNDRYEFNRILNFDTLTGAFYPWTIPEDNNRAMLGTVSLDDRTPVGTSSYRYLVGYSTGTDLVTWAQNETEDRVDWGTDVYSSYFITGYKVHGQAQRKFQTPYVYMYSDSLEDTRYRLQGIWNFARSANTGRYTSVQLVDILQNDYGFACKKHKIRGAGLAMQLKISSVDNNPFNIIGWSIWETANAHI